MKVSIIIPTFNEEKTIGHTLKSLIDQDYDGKYEILIVDGNSTDNTRNVISKFIKNKHNIKILSEKNDKPNIARARNIGIKNAKGDIIAFIDSGRIAPKNWLKKITDCFKDKTIVGVGGGFQLTDNLNTIEKFTALDKIYRTNLQKKYTDVVCTGNAAFRKKTIKDVHGFDEFFAKRGENTDFCYRICKKGKILCKPNIKTYYKDSFNINKFIREHILNGFYYFFICLKYRNKTLKDDYRKFSFIIQPFIISLFLLSLFFNPLFSIFLFTIFIFVNIRFIKFISKYDSKYIILPFIFLQLIRNISWILGVSWAILHTIKIKISF